MSTLEERLREAVIDQRERFVPGDDLPDRIAHRTRQRQQRRQRAFATACAAFLLVVAGASIVALQRDGRSPVATGSNPKGTAPSHGIVTIQAPTNGMTTTADRITVSGTYEGLDTRLYTYDVETTHCTSSKVRRPVVVDSDGNWSFEQRLAGGANEIRVFELRGTVAIVRVTRQPDQHCGFGF